MPSPLTDEEIEEIQDDYAETGSIKQTAENVDRSIETVQKYTKSMREDDDDGEEQDRFVADSANRDLSDMSPGEFIQYFFEEFSMGSVKDDFISVVANTAEARGEVPDQETMKHMLQNSNSGIGNANDAALIAETYWRIAEPYLQQTARGQQQSGVGTWQAPQGQPNQQGQPQQNQGQWHTAGGMGGPRQGGAPQQPYQGQHPPQGGQMGGQQTPGGEGQMIAQILQQQQQMMETMMQQQSSNEPSETEVLREELRELRQEINDSDDSGGMMDDLKQLSEAQKMLESMTGGDGDENEAMEQMAMALQQEIRGLREEMTEDSGVDMNPLEMAGGDTNLGLLALLAQRDDADAGTLADIAKQMGQVESDPEVAEKKIEKEIKKMEREMEQEKWDKIIGGLEETLGGVLGSIGGGDGPGAAELLDQATGGGGSAQQNQQQATRQDARQTQEVAEARPVEHQNGQQTPGQEQTEPQSAQEQSTARRVLEERTDAGGEPDPTPQTTQPAEKATGRTDGGAAAEATVEQDVDVVPAEETTPGDDPAAPEDAEESDSDPKNSSGLFVCEECGEEFESEMGLRGHMNAHN